MIVLNHPSSNWEFSSHCSITHCLPVPFALLHFPLLFQTMAEQIPYSVAENLLMKLGSAVFREIGSMYGVEDQLGKLNNTLSTVRAVLLDAEERQETNQAVAGWVRRLKEVVYDADDLLDDFVTEDLRRKTDDRSRFVRQISDFFSSSNHLVFRSEMGHRMKAIMERLDDIANDINNFKFLLKQTSGGRVRNSGRETCSVVGRSHKIVGRDENKREIIDLLMQSSTSPENLSMVAITGIGGLGKTTLAQLVYNDQRVADYFIPKMWVCVSDVFNAKTPIRNIIKSAIDKDVENLELDQLRNRLQKNLDGKRYLLVLDDVWNEDKKTWREFKNLLPVGANGSKILVTTRSSTVALAAEIDSPYVVEGLKEDESWDLFQSLAFRNGEEKTRPNLVAMGKDIVKMCCGVPLVIETLGSMLCFETMESKWMTIKNNKNLLMLEEGNNILFVLRLSYDNLPTHLKQCFAYCALFPKDYEIEKKLLVQLWMAQGYLGASMGNTDLEKIGNQYFEDLLARSLFLEIKRDEVKNDRLRYKMHDLIHDLAQSIMKSEVLILTDDLKTIPKIVHHVSWFKYSNVERINDLRGKSIRTLFMEHGYIDDHNQWPLSSLKYSQVLKVCFPQQEKVPTNWSKLSHLRFLDLSGGRFEKLPNAITRLKHLQTLKLLGCGTFKEWPGDMKKLINLRHLEIDGSHKKINYMPRGLGELTQLQTLPIYMVGKDKHMKMGGGLSELKSLNQLRDQLMIEWHHSDNGMRGTNEAKEGILEGKQHLDRLHLCWRGKQENEEVASIMDSLKPHQNLKELSIFEYGGKRFPDWMMNDGLALLLPNLVKIEMCNCYTIQVLPPFGQLPSLKTLRLEGFNAVEYMKDYPTSSLGLKLFPSLKSLSLWFLFKLEGWPGRRDVAMDVEDLELKLIKEELCMHLISISSSSLKSLHIQGIEDLISVPEGLQHASALQTLEIKSCSALTTLPHWISDLTSLAELHIERCDKLTSLPQEMLSLRHLRRLKIHHCPVLTPRCRKETGEDWPLISHIPYIHIPRDTINMTT